MIQSGGCPAIPELPEKPAEALVLDVVLEVLSLAAPPLEIRLSRPPVVEGSLEDVDEA